MHAHDRKHTPYLLTFPFRNGGSKKTHVQFDEFVINIIVGIEYIMRVLVSKLCIADFRAINIDRYAVLNTNGNLFYSRILM